MKTTQNKPTISEFRSMLEAKQGFNSFIFDKKLMKSRGETLKSFKLSTFTIDGRKFFQLIRRYLPETSAQQCIFYFDALSLQQIRLHQDLLLRASYK